MIGTLQADVILDKPNVTRWGSDDLILGRIIVSLQSETQRELFGPLVLKITFRGRTVQTFTSGNFKYKEQRGLFTIHHTVHDGPYRFAPGVKAWFPFSLNFPATTSLTKPDSAELPGYVYQSSPDQPLPPSFEIWGRDLKVATEYRLGVNGGMPGISVKFLGRPAATGPLLRFDGSQPDFDNRPQKTHTWKEDIRIPEWQCLPVPERPNLLKRLAGSLSTREQSSDYSFSMLITVPLDLYIDQKAQIVFQAQLPGQDDGSEQNQAGPKITLSHPAVKVWAETRATFTRTLIRSKTLTYNMTSFDLEESLRTTSAELHSAFTPSSPTKTFSTDKLTVRPSTFDTGVLGRAYTLQIGCTLNVAGKEVKLKKSFGVRIHPPPKPEVLAVRRAEARSTSLPRYESSTVPPYHEVHGGNVTMDPLRIETAA